MSTESRLERGFPKPAVDLILAILTTVDCLVDEEPEGDEIELLANMAKEFREFEKKDFKISGLKTRGLC